MTIKSSQELVSDALKQVTTIPPEKALELINDNKCNLIDIRDALELQSEGSVENTHHMPRGLLEFMIHPESPFFKNENLDPEKEMVLFCAAGGRSALAAKTLQEMGFKKVSHIEGGFKLMKQKGFKIKN